MVKPAENEIAAIRWSHIILLNESMGFISDKISPLPSNEILPPKNVVENNANVLVVRAIKIRASAELRVLNRIHPDEILDIANNPKR